MLLNEKRPSTSEPRQLRVKIPMQYHLKLHAIKILHQKKINEVVQEALEQYFATMREEGKYEEALTQKP